MNKNSKTSINEAIIRIEADFGKPLSNHEIEMIQKLAAIGQGVYMYKSEDSEGNPCFILSSGRKKTLDL